MKVRMKFNDGTNDYIFPLVFGVSDPEAGGKDVVIDGNRGDGSIVIPSGKKSHEISIKGKIWGEDYKEITEKIAEMRMKVTRNLATLTLEHYDEEVSGDGWVTDWIYNVRRISEIGFPESLRTSIQDYEVSFFVINY